MVLVACQWNGFDLFSKTYYYGPIYDGPCFLNGFLTINWTSGGMYRLPTMNLGIYCLSVHVIVLELLSKCYVKVMPCFLLFWRYARQVAEFFEFVKKKQEIDFIPQCIHFWWEGLKPVPHKSGLWILGGNHFPESALKSLDFRQAMSFLSG